MKHIRTIERSFGKFGGFVYDNKWMLAIITFLMNGILGLGLLSLSLNNDIEDLYLNKHTETKKFEETLSKLYPDKSGTEFQQHASVKLSLFVEVIVFEKENKNLFDPLFIAEIENLIDYVRNISISSHYQGLTSYNDVCARNAGKCVVAGIEVIDELNKVNETNSYVLNLSHLASTFSKQKYASILESLGNFTQENNTVFAASYLKLRFYLRQNTIGVAQDSRVWQRHFVKHMPEFQTEHLDFVYCHPTSLFEELGEDTYPDIQYFSLAFTILLFYLGFYVSGGDCVSKRVNIGRMGTIVVPLGVLGAWGLVSGAGLQFTNTVGVMPYFAVCYEANNMLITLYNVTDLTGKKCARDRISMALRMSGIPITITTITYVAAFIVGTRSDYLAMKLFSVYTVATLLFIYANHMVFFTACLSIHEQRIDASRHCCTCNIVHSKTGVSLERSSCFRCCCTGEKPSSLKAVSSTIEKLSRKLLSHIVFIPYIKWSVLVLFVLYTGVSLWRIIDLKVDIFKPEYVTKGSYFMKYEKVNRAIFPSNFYVSFVVPGYILNQHGGFMIHDFLEFEGKIIENPYINSTSLISWIDEYELFLNSSSSINCTQGETFNLFLSLNSRFRNDFAFLPDGSILSTKMYAKTVDIYSSSDVSRLKRLLLKEEEISDNKRKFDDLIRMTRKSSGSFQSAKSDEDHEMFVALYAPIFMYTDKSTSPLVECMTHISVMVGTNIILMVLVYPHCLSFVIIGTSFIAAILGLFGFMAVLHIDLTPFSMITSVLGVCYIVEVITHTMYSFYNIIAIDRLSRAHVVLSTVSVILFNTSLASFIGLLILFVEKSYVFLTVMKVLMIVTGICCFMAAFILPIFLSLFGPHYANNVKTDKVAISVLSIKKQETNSCATHNKMTTYSAEDIYAFENKTFETDRIAVERF